MPRAQYLCQRYPNGDTFFGNDIRLGGYRCATRAEQLPRAYRRDEGYVTRGFAVGIGAWYFFGAQAPAMVFGRSARMSAECGAYGVYEAARVVRYCDLHREDERVLLIGRHVERSDNELQTAMAERFARGVAQRPDSAHWYEPVR